MSSIKIVDTINRVSTKVVDTTKTRWTSLELLSDFNDAVLAVVNRRPDANIQNTSFNVTLNKSKQSLPANGLRWIDVVSNEDTGVPIRKTMRRQLDDQVPSWHNSTGEQITNFIFDERDPKSIYIYPQPSSAKSINVIYSVAPTPAVITDFVNDTQTLPIDDSYFNAIFEFMLYRAYIKDADYASNAQRAASHYQVFLSELGEKFQIDQAYNPDNNRVENNG